MAPIQVNQRIDEGRPIEPRTKARLRNIFGGANSGGRAARGDGKRRYLPRSYTQGQTPRPNHGVAQKLSYLKPRDIEGWVHGLQGPRGRDPRVRGTLCSMLGDLRNPYGSTLQSGSSAEA